MSMIDASSALYQALKSMNLQSDPTVVLAFDDYNSMYEFWMNLIKEHQDHLYGDWSVRSLRENQRFQIHGVKYIMRLKIKE